MSRQMIYPRQLTVRLTEQESGILHRHAGEAGLSVARYLVAAGLQHAPVSTAAECVVLQRAVFHAKKIGTNLNQIAHRLNGEASVPPVELREALLAAT